MLRNVCSRPLKGRGKISIAILVKMRPHSIDLCSSGALCVLHEPLKAQINEMAQKADKKKIITGGNYTDPPEDKCPLILGLTFSTPVVFIGGFFFFLKRL